MPVKRLRLAKSRLDVAGRDQLALAMALDTAEAILACRLTDRLVVVTDDERAGSHLAGLGARVVADEPDAGLNPALRYGAAVAAGMGPATGTAAVSADLPALRAAELELALESAAGSAYIVVADAAGDGTTLYAGTAGRAFEPRFGPGSLRDHVAAGAVVVDLPAVSGLRRDVDTTADLAAAVSLGVGPSTRRFLARRRRPSDAARTRRRAG